MPRNQEKRELHKVAILQKRRKKRGEAFGNWCSDDAVEKRDSLGKRRKNYSCSRIKGTVWGGNRFEGGGNLIPIQVRKKRKEVSFT